MTTYVISGKLGAGKTLAAVGKIREALNKGLRVATNLDLYPDKLVSIRNKSSRILRLPDHPQVDDFEALGYGSDSVDEDTHGYLVLDECATWLNARQWGNDGRKGTIDWLLHARKYRWHIVLIVQHPNLIDKQVRESIVELYGFVRRLDRIKLPWIGVRLPKVHVCAVKYGLEQGAVRAERWIYQAKDLYQAYDTGQVFDPNYPHGLYTLLPPWYTHGRYLPPKRSVLRWLAIPVLLVCYFLVKWFDPVLFRSIQRRNKILDVI